MRSVWLTQVVARIKSRQAVLNEAQVLAADRVVDGVASLDKATPTQLAFLASARYAKALKTTQAAAVIVDTEHASAVPKSSLALVVHAPYLAYASASALFDNSSAPCGIHPTAIVDKSATLGKDARIDAYAVVEADAIVGAQSYVGVGARIGRGAVVGDRSVIESYATIAHDCVVGVDCRVHAHASIGSEGFGFAPHASGWERIAQLGRVVIGDRVRIGSHTCVDRGAVDDTVIESDVIVDNLVQIAHNVRIGQGTAIAAQTGIAGSTIIGKGCIIGGAVGIAGHLQIADRVTLTGRSFVTKSIAKAGSYSSGTPAMPTEEWRRAAVLFRQSGKK